MKTKTAFRKCFILLLALSVLFVCAGCGSVKESGPAASAAATDTADASMPDIAAAKEAYEKDEVVLNENGMRIVRVSGVDEFLFAIAENTEIIFEPGVYDLTTASDYGKNTFSDVYLWEEVFDGYQLVIHSVSNLMIRGESAEETHITTTPRYANVLAFEGCSEITVEELTMGHTILPGQCVGGVVYLDCVDNAAINSCRLYGCGVMGIWATESTGIRASGTEIYNCSENAVYAYSCAGFTLDGCSIHDCPGSDGESECMSLFDVSATSDFVIQNCEVYGNRAQGFLHSYLGSHVAVLNTLVNDNIFSASLFCCTEFAPVADGCSFGNDQLAHGASVYSTDEHEFSLHAVDLDGNELDADDLYAMERESLTYSPSSYDASADYSEPRELYAQTVDEFLAAIAPNTTIHLSEGEYLLSDALNYGSAGSAFYYWENTYDGYTLVINGVDGLNILSDSPVRTSILSDSAYANVLSFRECSNTLLSGFTMGHTIESYCSGEVITLNACDSVGIEKCRLFGCGILGISATGCSNLSSVYCEIFDCPGGAINLAHTDIFELNDCVIHDCGIPTVMVDEKSKISINGNEYSAGNYTIQSSNTSGGSAMWVTPEEALEFAKIIKQAAVKKDYETFANRVKYPITVEGKTYDYASQLSRDLSLIFAEDFTDILKNDDLSDIQSGKHSFSFASGRISFSQFNGELLICEILPPSVG